MPSANNLNPVKADKLVGAEQPDAFRQALTIVEHKIRNLEKRKSRLDSYREVKSSGKGLTKDQTEAASKYEEVLQQLDLARDLMKQFTVIGDAADKSKKKTAKKEILERTAADTAKIKHVLIIQDVLQSMGGDQVRQDFLAGSNGAPLLTQLDLKSLDDLYAEIYPKHEPAVTSVPFSAQLQKAAEHLLAIVEGKSREVAGSTGAKLQALITTISTCQYFDIPEPVAETVEPEPHADSETPDNVDTAAEEEVAQPAGLGLQQQQQQPPTHIPATSVAPIHTIIQNIVPVSQVESNIFNAQGFQPPINGVQPVPQQAQPVVSVTPQMTQIPNLTFFQESQIDASELPAASITSRTFTNQNFNGQPAQPTFPPAPNTAYFVPGYRAEVEGYGTVAADMTMYPTVANGAPPALPVDPHPQTHSQGVMRTHVTSNGYSGVSGHNNYQVPASVPSVPATPSVQPLSAEADLIPAQLDEVKADVGQMGDWSNTENRLDWAADGIDEWNPSQPDEGSRKTGGNRGRGERGDRPRNYHRSNNNNRNNYRSGPRESGGNGSFYSNNQNGYQSRDREPRNDRDRDFQPRQDREYQPRQDREYQPRGDRRGGPPRPRQDRQDRQDRPPRSDRQDRSYSHSGTQNNSGGRGPRNSNRPPSANYRQESHNDK